MLILLSEPRAAPPCTSMEPRGRRGGGGGAGAGGVRGAEGDKGLAEVAQVVDILDWVNVMSYDFHGGWEASTHFNSPLFAGADFPAGADDPNTVETSVETYLALGVPPEKLVVGLALYGRAWAGTSSANNGLFQSGSRADGTWEAGIYEYWDIEANYLTRGDCTRYWHDEAKVPWLRCSDPG